MLLKKVKDNIYTWKSEVSLDRSNSSHITL